MSASKYKELNSYHNSLNIQGTDVGERITLEKRMNPRKRMFPSDKNVHMRNQIFIFGSEVEKQQELRDHQHFVSEYHRTYEESSKLVQNGEGIRMVQAMRPAGVVQDKDFNLSNIDQMSHRRHTSMNSPMKPSNARNNSGREEGDSNA